MASLSEAITKSILEWGYGNPGMTVIDIMSAFMEIRVSLMQAERDATNIIVLSEWARKNGRVRPNIRRSPDPSPVHEE